MTIDELVHVSWTIAENHGFHEGRTNSRDDTLVRLCLVHTEVSEASQVVKRSWLAATPQAVVDDLAEELADVLIRVADLAGCLSIDLEQAVEKKLKINDGRKRHYGTPREEK